MNRLSSNGQMDFSSVWFNKSLSDNTRLFKSIFCNTDTVVFRTVQSSHNPAIQCCLVFFDGMVNSAVMAESLLTPIMQAQYQPAEGPVETFLQNKVLALNDAALHTDVLESVNKALYGDTLVLIEGYAGALAVNTKGFATRSIAEPDDERALRGPREGFTESIMTNMAMLRRKLLTNDLKFKYMTFGTRSNTKACLCYLDNLVDKKILADLETRLQTIHVDGVLESNAICERIKDAPFSLFKTTGQTEKPDILAAKLLEGRIALLLDGTPVVITVPYLFIENFQAADDYYNNFYYSSFNRLLRILAFFISVCGPALYIAMTVYHLEIIPSNLMLSIAAAEKGVPFPILVECIVFIIVFELLRETGIRMPNKVGPAMSIVGALVMGQAAIEAKLISAPTVIVVALGGIAGLVLPRLAGSIVILRFLFLLSASILGYYGIFFCMLWLILYLSKLKSFGVDFTSQMIPFEKGLLPDIYIRAPFRFAQFRPERLTQNRRREGKM